MTYDETIVEHSMTSNKHHAEVMGALNDLKSLEMKEGDAMSVNIEEALLGAGRGGADSGGGLVMGLVLGSLLRNGGGGLLGGDGAAGGVGLQNSIDTNAILTQLGDIKASVPLSACETMAAVSNAQADITSQTLAQTIGLNQNINDAKAAALAAANANALQNSAGFAGVKDATDSLATQQAVGFGVINANIERTGWQLSREINADGDKTRALIQSIDKQNDSRLITAQANEIVELRASQARAEDRHGIEINMTNNQNQNQLQFQQQSQVLNTLSNGLVQALQSIQATNQAINIGGFQQANPTNTNTNVRA